MNFLGSGWQSDDTSGSMIRNSFQVREDEERAGNTRVIQHFVVFVCIAFSALGIVFLGSSVRTQLSDLASVQTDGVEMSLARIRTDFHDLEAAVDRARAGYSGVDDIGRSLDQISARLEILRSDERFRGIGGVGQVFDSMERTSAFVETVRRKLVPGVDYALLGQYVRMHEFLPDAIEENGIRVLKVYTATLRTNVAATLVRLAGFVAVLLITMLILTIYLSWQGRIVLARARREASAASRLEAILDTSQDGVVVVDGRGRIRACGASALRLFGAEEIGIMGRRLSNLISVPENILQEVRQDTFSGIREVEMILPNGIRFFAEISGTAVGEKKSESTVYFIRDVSHRKAIEKELIEARDEALAGQAAKSSFVAIMSHEIRTPLNGIVGIIDLLSETDLSEEQSRLLKNMEVSSRVLLSHLNNVLDISRSEAGNFVLAPRSSRLRDIVRDVVQCQADIASSKGNRIVEDVIGDDDMIYEVDPDRLRQVLINLVNNSQKFTESGEIRIEVEKLMSDGPKDRLEIRVCDTGTGIPESRIGKIFDDFETLDTSYARNQSGAGLGLGIVRRIVDAMNGTVDVESIEGESTQFTITLDLPRSDAPWDVSGHSKVDQGEIVRTRILVAEDNDINRTVFEKILEKMGAQVTAVNNGALALESSQKQEYDVIFMDVSMPVMDGLTATREMRAAGVSADILATTADISFSEKADYDQSGFSGLIPKPVSRDTLRRILCSRELPIEVRKSRRSENDDAATAILNWEILDEMRQDIGEETLSGLVSKMMDEAADLVRDLEGMTCWKSAALSLHSLAGAAGTCGATRMNHVLRSLENTVRTKEIVLAPDDMRLVRTVISSTEKEYVARGLL